jgi:hypothetical protein
MKTENSDRLEDRSENRPVAPQTPEVSDSKRSEFEQLGDERELSLVGEFWVFIKENKAWWMVPILLVLGGLGILVMLSSTGAAPFIYTLF